ncbi:MAG: hypothetical protein J6A96_04470 [Clostridia bacterium]|nr:hypothetical protein [Clostridia bacterium]
MGKIKKRIFAVVMITLIIFTIFSVSSCKGIIRSNTEAEEYVATLVEKSYEINVIVFGDGLPHLDEKDPENPLYSPVIENEKYKTISDIRLAIREVYSEEYAKSLETIAFSGSPSGVEGSTLFPRYITNSAGELLILTDYTILDYESPTHGKYEGLNVQKYDTSTIEIKKISLRFVEANITSEDGKTTILVTLIRQEAGSDYVWRLNSATC